MQCLLLFHILLIWHYAEVAKASPHTEILTDAQIHKDISTDTEIHTDISTDTEIHTDISTDTEIHTEIPAAETDIMKFGDKFVSACEKVSYSCEPSPSYDNDIMPQRKCHCHSFCSNLRTCCFDSPYRHLTPTFPKPSCQAPLRNDDPIFMIDRCPDKTDTDMKQKCEMDQNEDDADFFMLIPVSSLATNVTYKNYFCFRCNEEHDEILYWKVKVSADVPPDTEVDERKIVPVYVSSKRSWMAPLEPDGSLAEVEISVQDQEEVQHLKKLCFPDVISNCSEDWKDDEIRQKCNYPYTLITIFISPGRVFYKNPHCAICNSENLDESICEYKPPHMRRKFFSFSMLLDINTSKCEEGHVWDSHFKKCRALKCALPGYAVNKDKCIKTE